MSAYTRYIEENPKNMFEQAVFEVLDDMLGRQGFDSIWGNIDEDLRDEILVSWTKIVEDTVTCQ